MGKNESGASQVKWIDFSFFQWLVLLRGLAIKAEKEKLLLLSLRKSGASEVKLFGKEVNNVVVHCEAHTMVIQIVHYKSYSLLEHII